MSATEAAPEPSSPPRTMVFLDVDVPDLNHPLKPFRNCPWVDDPGWQVEFWGVTSPAAARKAGPVSTHGFALSRKAPVPVRFALAWAAHLWLTLRRPSGRVLWASTPLKAVGAIGARALLRHRPPLVVRLIGRSSSRARRLKGWRVRAAALERLEDTVLRRADVVVPMGTFTRSLARAAGVPDARIVELREPPSWKPQEAPTGDRDRAPKTVVCAARLVPDKGVDLLVRAVADVSRRHPDVLLEVAGHGAEQQALERLAAELGVADRVRFRGLMKPRHLAELFRTSGVAVLASRVEEGMGMALVEAGSMGCVLVGPDLGGVRDIVVQGETGLLVPPGSHGGFAVAFERIFDDPAGAARMAANARAAAEAYLGGRDAQLEQLRQRVEGLLE